MTDSKESLDLVKSLLASQSLAVLATQDHGQPYTSLMAFAATDDLKYLILATTRPTRKFANLLAEPRVALLVDNRANEPADFSKAAAVTALGKTWELQGRDRQDYLKIYLAKHPYLEEFASSPDCALLRVAVEKYILVTRFQEVREVYPTG
ncbi:MAG: pyridoxamine 5'-phosphate oxidase family protein [Deltaproteobacteria bacterium]|nr:pyridoxamine 5'-phosphate oxidase family protein [Deltaproteobacteria bacterium]